MFWYLNYLIIIINYLILFISKPAKQVISLDVEYAPEVEATEIFVHAATGNIHTQIYISLNRKVLQCLMMYQKDNHFAFKYFREQCGACLQCACSPHSHCKMVQKQDGANWRCGTGNNWKIDRAKLPANIVPSRFESLMKLKIRIAKRF